MRSTIEEQAVAPIGNTGQIAQTETDNPIFTVRVDWLRAIVPIKKSWMIAKNIQWLMKWFKDEFTWYDAPVREGKQWDNYGRSVCGITAYYTLPDPEKGTQGEMMIDIPARAIARVEQQIFFWVCERLYYDYQARATRVDIALDIRKDSRWIQMEDVEMAVKLGNVKRFQKRSFVDTYKGQNLVGWTAYLGSRQSDVMFRIYDKDLESKGRIKSIRIEGEYHNELADSVFQNIARIFAKCHQYRNGYEYVATALSNLFFDEKYGLCFLDRYRSDKFDRESAYRSPELPWWEMLRLAVQGFFKKGEFKPVLAKSKVVGTLDKSLDWAINKVANTLTALKEVFGEEFVNAAMKKNPKSLPLHIQKKIAVARLEIELGMLSAT